MSSAQQQIFVIVRVVDIMEFDNMLQICFNCSYGGSTPLPTRIIEPSTHWLFTCSKSVVWNLRKIFVKEFIFSKILRLLHAALLKKLLHRYFSRSFIIDLRIPIFTKLSSVAASKIHKFLTSFMKSVCMLKINICFSTRMYFLPV